MLTVIRELADAAEESDEVAPAELLKTLVERGDEAVARTPEPARGPARGRRRRRRRRGTRRARSRPRRHRFRRAPRGAACSRRACSRRRCTRSPRATATAPPSWSKATGSTREALETRARAAGRLAARRRRPRGAQDPRSHRRPGRGAVARHRRRRRSKASRSRTCTVRPSSASSVSSRRSPAAPRAPGWSPWSPARATAACSRASARRGSSRAAQTMNPSTADLVEAVDAARRRRGVLLPNNTNVVMAPSRPPGSPRKPVHVVPTESIPAGLAALVAFDAERSRRGERRRR